jgi:fatty-acid peroxygenase
MVAVAGSAGPLNWRGLLVRTRTEQWARALVDAVRAGLAQPAFDSPLNVIAQHRDAAGNRASREDAAAELLGLLRSTEAVARCITFGVLALHEAFGFCAVGRMREVGRKFDQWLDVGYWECLLAQPA